MKNLASFSLLHKKIEFISQNCRWLFSAFYTQTHVIYGTKFPTNLCLTILPTIFISLPFYPQHLLISSSWCHPLRWCHPGRPAPSHPPLDAAEHSCLLPSVTFFVSFFTSTSENSSKLSSLSFPSLNIAFYTRSPLDISAQHDQGRHFSVFREGVQIFDDLLFSISIYPTKFPNDLF